VDWDNLKGDPRFGAVLAEIGLTEAASVATRGLGR
jgi:hypothetical protein